MPPRQPRRSKRLVLSVPVHVLGQDVFRESFNEFTRMLSLSAHGVSLTLAAQVDIGQTILVVNRSTGKEQECRVAHVGPMKDRRWETGHQSLVVGRSFQSEVEIVRRDEVTLSNKRLKTSDFMLGQLC